MYFCRQNWFTIINPFSRRKICSKTLNDRLWCIKIAFPPTYRWKIAGYRFDAAFVNRRQKAIRSRGWNRASHLSRPIFSPLHPGLSFFQSLGWSSNAYPKIHVPLWLITFSKKGTVSRMTVETCSPRILCEWEREKESMDRFNLASTSL